MSQKIDINRPKEGRSTQESRRRTRRFKQLLMHTLYTDFDRQGAWYIMDRECPECLRARDITPTLGYICIYPDCSNV